MASSSRKQPLGFVSHHKIHSLLSILLLGEYCKDKMRKRLEKCFSLNYYFNFRYYLAAGGLRKYICILIFPSQNWSRCCSCQNRAFLSNDELQDVLFYPEKEDRALPHFFKYLERKLEQLFPALHGSCTVVISTVSQQSWGVSPSPSGAPNKQWFGMLWGSLGGLVVMHFSVVITTSVSLGKFTFIWDNYCTLNVTQILRFNC